MIGGFAVHRWKILILLPFAALLAGCATALVGGGGGGNPPPIFSLTVSPQNATIRGGATQQFAAQTSDKSTPALTWTVNGVAGGDAAHGTISATGLYTAPEFPPAQNPLTIGAFETADTTKTGSTSETVDNPIPQITTVTPMSIAVGAFTLTVNGAHFAPSAVVYFGTVALTTTRISSTQLTATGTATASQAGTVNITVQNPDPGTAKSGPIAAVVVNSSVSITPPSSTVRAGAQQQFSATVSGVSNQGVTWSVNGVAGGNATVGTIIGNGLYQAPATIPTANTVTVTATSVADTTKSGNAAVTLQNAIPVLTTVNPTSVTVGAFSLTLTGSGFMQGSVVNFGTQKLTTTYVSATQLTATGTATSAQIGTVGVSVTNPDPGSATSAIVNVTVAAPNPAITVTVTPNPATVAAQSHQIFSATVTGTTNTSVTWQVNGINYGDGDSGRIDGNGNFTAPDIPPSPNPVTVTAVSAADTTKKGNATVTITNPAPVLTSISPATIGPGPFQLTLNGSGFVNTSTATFGGKPLIVTYASPTFITAIGTAATAPLGAFPVVVTNPAPGGGVSGAVNVTVINTGGPVQPPAAVRFLEQASFGPDPETVNQVEQTGFDTYLQNQFAAAQTPYPDPAPKSSIYDLQQQYFLHSIAGGDQLRQRAALALNELWVVGADKVGDPLGYTNYLRTLNKNALGNYYDVMKDITLTPAMGHYLDMVDNDKPDPGQHANENYAREIMQLFCLGLYQLNPDGTQKLDASNNPIATYTQDDVMALGRAFTGWTYPSEPGYPPKTHNPEYYGGNMLAVESNHDTDAKTLLGQAIPAGQSAEADLDASLTIIFNHPNVGPFVAKQLILRLVSSNPSPAYVQRVAQAFNSGTFNTYGSGKRGDLQATLAAVLLDAEARQGDTPATSKLTDGKLREPVIVEASLARAFHAQTDAAGFQNEAGTMNQNIFYPPTVFNFFPPVNPIPGTTLNGPEFAIFDTTTSLARMNFINDAVYGAIGSNTHLDFTPVQKAGSTDQMLTWLDTLFLHGTMPAQMKQTITTALAALDPADTQGQAQAAIYLVTSSSLYQVQH